jgi:hypothetical protein
MNATPPLSDAARNERIKLTATFFNTVASGSVVVGGVTPIAALAFAVPAMPTHPAEWVVGIALGFIATGVGLHWFARTLLGALK